MGRKIVWKAIRSVGLLVATSLAKYYGNPRIVVDVVNHWFHVHPKAQSEG
jgi:hypothetical protein